MPYSSYVKTVKLEWCYTRLIYYVIMKLRFLRFVVITRNQMVSLVNSPDTSCFLPQFMLVVIVLFIVQVVLGSIGFFLIDDIHNEMSDIVRKAVVYYRLDSNFPRDDDMNALQIEVCAALCNNSTATSHNRV